MTRIKISPIIKIATVLFFFYGNQLAFAQQDSVLVCNVKFKDSKFNNPHAGSGFLLKHNEKIYGITAKHVLFFAKTDSMKSIDFGNALKSWTFQSKSTNNSIKASKLINQNPNEAIEMPPKGDWLIFEVTAPIPDDVVVYQIREKPLEIGEKFEFLGVPYKREKAICVQGNFIGFTPDKNLKLKVPNGNYGGCSGGPVLDSEGKLVGIVSMGYFNKKENQYIFEPASLDYFKQVINL